MLFSQNHIALHWPCAPYLPCKEMAELWWSSQEWRTLIALKKCSCGLGHVVSFLYLYPVAVWQSCCGFFLRGNMRSGSRTQAIKVLQHSSCRRWAKVGKYHGIIECLESEGTHEDHQVQLMTLCRTTPKFTLTITGPYWCPAAAVRLLP